MKFRMLRLENYGSFWGQHVFRLDGRGIVLIMGSNFDEPRMGSNGSGKSTLGEAIEWCLFGKPPRGDAAASIINTETGAGCRVRVDLLDGQSVPVVIERIRGFEQLKDGVRVWVGSSEKTTLDPDKTQEVIEDLLGLDRELFHAAVLRSAELGSFSFARATDGERKELLTRIIEELGECDEHAARVDELLKAARWQAEKLTGKQAAIESEARAIQAADNATRASEWGIRQAQALETFGKDLAQAEEEHAALATSLAQTPAPIHVPDPPYPQDLAGIDYDLKRLTAQRDQAIKTMAGLQAGLLRHQQDHAALRPGQCPMCLQPVEKYKTDARAEVLVQHIEDATNGIAECQGVLSFVEQTLGQVSASRVEVQERWMAAKQAAAAQRTVVAEATRRAMELAEHTKRAAARATEFRARFEAQKNQTNPYAATAAKDFARLTVLYDESRGLASAIAEANARIVQLEFWQEGFSGKGLKSWVLDARLHEMSEAVNRWVKVLTGGTIWVRFETQSAVGKGAKAKLVETFALRVFRWNPDGTTTERNFKSWSSGEKYRVELGVDFGLMHLLASKAKRATNVMFLDEVFGRSLDAAGKEAVADLLAELAKSKDSLFVVDHDVQFQGLFQEVVRVVKRGGRSRIEEIAHGTQEKVVDQAPALQAHPPPG